MLVTEFLQNARALVGLPYSKCDCIGVVRRAAKISCQGTNWLWRSINNSPKYRYLKWRAETAPTEPRPGTLVFRIRFDQVPPGYDDRPNCHHVGIILDDGNVIESQERDGVHISKYIPSMWDGAGWLKQIDALPDPVEDLPPSDPEPPDVYPSDRDMIIALYRLFILDRD